MRILLAASTDGAAHKLQALLSRLDPAHEVRITTDPGAAVPADGFPELLVIDVDPSPADAPSIVAAAALRYPPSRIVAMGTPVDDAIVASILEAGALGYLPKNFSETVMLGILRLILGRAAPADRQPVAGGDRDGDLSQASSDNESEAGLELDLTPRQVEVLALVSEGKPNHAIAKQLGIGEGTVKLHVTAIFKALKVSNRGEAILLASRLRSVNFRHIKQAEGGRLDLDWLLPHMSHRHLALGAVVFRKGDVGKELFYLQRGTVRLDEIDAEINAGAMFGEIGIFSPDHERTVTAKCSTEVDLFTLSAEQVKRLYLLNPQFALFTVHLIAKRLMADQARAL